MEGLDDIVIAWIAVDGGCKVVCCKVGPWWVDDAEIHFRVTAELSWCLMFDGSLTFSMHHCYLRYLSLCAARHHPFWGITSLSYPVLSCPVLSFNSIDSSPRRCVSARHDIYQPELAEASAAPDFQLSA